MLQSCDLTTGNSAAPTPYCQLSPSSSGSISNIGACGVGVAPSNSSNRLNTSDQTRHQGQIKSTIGIN